MENKIINAVELEHIQKSFPVYDEMMPETEQIRSGRFYALEDISFTLEQSSCIVIAGANGSGKSLLMSMIASLETPDSGSVKTSGRVGLVFQEPDAQILGETPREDIAFGPRNMGLSKAEIKICVENALIETGLLHRGDFPSRALSGGEKRRLAVAGVLAMNAEIIIFDEPYANMDFPGVKQINHLIKKLIADGKTVIILTHETEKCLALADHFIVLHRGKKVFDGSADEALNSSSVYLEDWGIKNPLQNSANKIEDLLWL
jgi:biotin transport system ATP-binding protein